MATVNSTITRIFDLFLALFAWGGAWAGVAALALVTAVLAMLIFRSTSNQRAIRRIKDLIISHLLEVALYRDDLRIVLRAQRAILWDNLRYLAHAMVPLVFMVIPVGLVLIQGELHYAHRPLRVGERAIVSVKIAAGRGDLEALAISAPAGLVVETPALRLPALREVDWRVRAVKEGNWDLGFSLGGTELAKRVVVGGSTAGIPAERVAGGAWGQLLRPGEPPLPGGGAIEAMRVSYPPAALRLFGREMAWVWPWLIVSLIFGYALKGPLRVQI